MWSCNRVCTGKDVGIPFTELRRKRRKQADFTRISLTEIHKIVVQTLRQFDLALAGAARWETSDYWFHKHTGLQTNLSLLKSLDCNQPDHCTQLWLVILLSSAFHPDLLDQMIKADMHERLLPSIDGMWLRLTCNGMDTCLQICYEELWKPPSG